MAETNERIPVDVRAEVDERMFEKHLEGIQEERMKLLQSRERLILLLQAERKISEVYKNSRDQFKRKLEEREENTERIQELVKENQELNRKMQLERLEFRSVKARMEKEIRQEKRKAGSMHSSKKLEETLRCLKKREIQIKALEKNLRDAKAKKAQDYQKLVGIREKPGPAMNKRGRKRLRSVNTDSEEEGSMSSSLSLLSGSSVVVASVVNSEGTRVDEDCSGSSSEINEDSQCSEEEMEEELSSDFESRPIEDTSALVQELLEKIGEQDLPQEEDSEEVDDDNLQEMRAAMKTFIEKPPTSINVETWSILVRRFTRALLDGKFDTKGRTFKASVDLVFMTCRFVASLRQKNKDLRRNAEEYWKSVPGGIFKYKFITPCCKGRGQASFSKRHRQEIARFLCAGKRKNFTEEVVQILGFKSTHDHDAASFRMEIAKKHK